MYKKMSFIGVMRSIMYCWGSRENINYSTIFYDDQILRRGGGGDK
jgi:hypothetical protein